MPVLVYDGACRFCTREALRLQRMAGGAVTLLSCTEPGALDRFPSLGPEDCMRELKLVHEDGRIEGGVAAVAGALRLGHRWRWLSAVLGAPGIRQVARLGYRGIARVRYRLMGRCAPDSACALHPRPGDAARPGADPAPPE